MVCIWRIDVPKKHLQNYPSISLPPSGARVDQPADQSEELCAKAVGAVHAAGSGAARIAGAAAVFCDSSTRGFWDQRDIGTNTTQDMTSGTQATTMFVHLVVIFRFVYEFHFWSSGCCFYAPTSSSWIEFLHW